MSGNTFSIDTVRQVEKLAKSLGGLDECRRLGFVVEDKQGIISLTPVGFGYLTYVEARELKSLAEAFAAGFECAWDLNHPED